jgi:hypothetical protein
MVDLQYDGLLNEDWNNLLPPSSTFMMEVTGSFASWVMTYQNTGCHMQEDHCL